VRIKRNSRVVLNLIGDDTIVGTVSWSWRRSVIRLRDAAVTMTNGRAHDPLPIDGLALVPAARVHVAQVLG
jgi:hypothetical protein